MNKRIEKDKINNILIITLSNVGDAILTTAAIEVVKREFPTSSITILVGPRAKCVFEKDPAIKELIVYKSPKTVKAIFKQFMRLKAKKFDLVIDFRNTLWGLLLFPHYHTPLIKKSPKNVVHKKDVHLWKLATLGFNVKDIQPKILFSSEDEKSVAQMVKQDNLDRNKKWVAISPGARSHIKRWTVQGFISLIRWLKDKDFEIIFIGNNDDRQIIDKIIKGANVKLHNFCEKTDVGELAVLLKSCALLITNDSAPLHVTSAVNTPTLAIFGPTDSGKYAPLAWGSRVIKKTLACLPCERALCRFNHECMQSLSAEEVIEKVKQILNLD